MIFKYQYTNETERETILSNHHDKFLVEEQNISEGNFLIFSDVLLDFQKPASEQIKEQLADRDRQIIELKKMQNVTDTTVSEISSTLQELIEITLEMGNV